MNHSPSPIDTVLKRLSDSGSTVRLSGSHRWMANCPVHDDQNPSLSLSTDSQNKVLIKCHAGCNTKDVLERLNLTYSDLNAEKPSNIQSKTTKPKTKHKAFDSAESAIAWLSKSTNGVLANQWLYRDQNNREVFRVLRFQTPKGKDYRPLHPSKEGYRIGTPSDKLPRYRLPDLPENETIYIVEGEKAADQTINIGLAATTSAHGAGSTKKTDWSPLKGRDIVILPDKDEAGKKYAHEVAR